jgi:DNA polymerase III psi subunit
MKSIPENEGLNSLVLSQILTEDIYIIPEKVIRESVSSKVVENKLNQEKPAEHLNIPLTSEKKSPLTKEIIVVLDEPATPKELEFLTKILVALKMTIQDVSIISKSDFSSDMNFKKLISFNVGIEKMNPGIKIEKYIMKEHGKAKFLYSDSLEELTEDVKKKKQLWEALQLMFSLK